ncbi:MAG: hypothetical protein FJW20_01605 [Acidimicrobiia bacterium]|nr:hypothetical protein [Acidimicrobiia bacterium]
MDRNPNSPHVLGARLILLAMEGNWSAVQTETRRIDSLEKDRAYHHLTYGAACANAMQGNAGEAVKWLRKTDQYGMPNYLLFSRTPHLEKIRGSAEYKQYMAERKARWEGHMKEFP